MKEKMWDLLELVLNALEIKSKAAEATRNDILNLRGNQEKAKAFLIHHDSEVKLNNCTSCPTHYFCSLYLACAYNEMDVITETQKHLKKAIRDFYVMGCEWNQTFATWAYGVTFLLMKDPMTARRHLEDTIEMFERLAKKFRLENDYEKRDECMGYIQKIREVLKNGNQPQENTQTEDELTDSEFSEALHLEKDEKLDDEEVLEENGDHLLFSWLPIYEEVQAGRDGPIWTSRETQNYVETSTLFIDNTIYRIQSLVAKKQHITLQRSKDYGWAPVQGHSMTEANIADGDYILFYKSPIPQENGIVVAARTAAHDEHAQQYLVKRYKYNMLYSETTLDSDEYKPIDAKHCQILGIVIAVAKPAKKDL